MSSLARCELVDGLCGRPGLHLDGHQHPAEAHQEIDLVGPDAEVPSADDGAALFEEPGRQILTPRA